MQGIIGGAPGEPGIGDTAQEVIVVDGITYGVISEDAPGFELPSTIIGITTIFFGFRQWREEID